MNGKAETGRIEKTQRVTNKRVSILSRWALGQQAQPGAVVILKPVAPCLQQRTTELHESCGENAR